MSHGKKIGKLVIRLDRVIQKVRWGGSGDHRAEFSVDLRFDFHTGDFFVEHDGKWYSAKTKEALEAKVKKAVERTIDLVWERYIVVSYEAAVRPVDPILNNVDGTTSNTYSIKDERDDLVKRSIRHGTKTTHVVAGIELTWEIVEYTKPWARPESGKLVRSKRDVRSGWDGDERREYIGDPYENDDDELPDGAVLWTKEREDLLHEILAMLGKLDAKMVDLFRGDAEGLAKKLDAAQLDPSRLLAAPPEPKVESKKKHGTALGTKSRRRA